jgi:predicted flap endonuclease-1-like 5' DNA nuclease
VVQGPFRDRPAYDRIDGGGAICVAAKGIAMKIEDVEGIGPMFRDKLHGANIQTTEDLLREGRTPSGRNALSEASGISATMLLEWINHADLMQIKGVGSEYADLLEDAGVDTVPELARRSAANLAAAMKDYNAEKEATRTTPSVDTVADWIAQAKTMGRSIEY